MTYLIIMQESLDTLSSSFVVLKTKTPQVILNNDGRKGNGFRKAFLGLIGGVKDFFLFWLIGFAEVAMQR